MKVLLLNQSFYPDPVATAQHTTDLALYLSTLGCQVTVLCGRRAYDNRSVLYERRENYKGVKIERVYYTGFGKRSFFTRLIDALTFELSLCWRLAWTRRHDVVVGFTSPPLIGFIGVVFCLIKGGQYVSWLMDLHPDTAVEVGYLKKNSFFHRFLRFVLEFSLKHSAHIVVLDRWMRKRVLGHKADPAKIAIVPPWPVHEEKKCYPATADNPFRKQHNLGERFVVLYSGNHSIAHPLDTLLNAAFRLKDDLEVVFLFIGSGLRVADVKRYAEEKKLRNILQLPYQPRQVLDQSLSSANLHVVVMGSTMSGLVHTSKIYGALATGRPYVFIGPKDSHVGDLLNKCSSGFQVEHGDVEGLVQTIAQSRGLTKEKLEEIEKVNMGYVANNYSAKKSLDHFACSVLGFSEPITQNIPSLDPYPSRKQTIAT